MHPYDRIGFYETPGERLIRLTPNAGRVRAQEPGATKPKNERMEKLLRDVRRATTKKERLQKLREIVRMLEVQVRKNGDAIRKLNEDILMPKARPVASIENPAPLLMFPRGRG